MSKNEIYEEVVDMCDYYYEKVGDIKTPMEMIDLQWYITDRFITLLRKIQESK